ncbi:hypothetical protein VCRA2122O12_110088 [Vibrio crassostreae]|nr:hypothetical protein VCRA2110O4_120090 [Vibrio crassostreae]CAK1790557.1 hypothetical protein VCRA2114E5_150088 [Vibrio crassostreae]CAK1981054.1 hypothetical protein VCRA2110O1_20264 [Vibrio crassostreae]CAK2774368.1 hypothetical protein VCRA2110O3_20262 [Vibrio crassostreae]CAK2789623.1 hypothetical protein VCRA2110O2_20307 [Vibrio crassostreae]
MNYDGALSASTELIRHHISSAPPNKLKYMHIIWCGFDFIVETKQQHIDVCRVSFLILFLPLNNLRTETDF